MIIERVLFVVSWLVIAALVALFFDESLRRPAGWAFIVGLSAHVLHGVLERRRVRREARETLDTFE